MTKEQLFFLNALSDHLEYKSTSVSEDLNWEKLIEIAKIHELEGILAMQCNEDLRPRTELSEVRKLLESAFQATIYLGCTMEYALQTVSTSFRKAGIHFLPVKGSAIAHLYPEPLLRTMGDLDLLVCAEDVSQFDTLMRNLGYKNTRWTEHEWDYQKNGVCFELQAKLFHEHALDSEKMRNYFNDFWQHTETESEGGTILNWNFHLLYLIAHIGKHMLTAGIGFRQFYDLAVLIRNHASLFNWEDFSAQAKEAGLWNFSRSCFTLCHHWFNVPLVLPVVEFSDQELEELTQYVFSNGVFGFQNQERRSKALSDLKKSSRLPMPMLKLVALLHFLFPSYQDLCTVTKYEGLRGHPLLLPWYWLKRLVGGLGNQARSRQFNSILTIRSKELSHRDERLKKLGL